MKRTITLVLPALVLALAACSSTAATPSPSATPAPVATPSAAPSAAAEEDIVGTATAAGSFKTLLTAATAAGLVETLQGKGPFTVFAPTDAAFEQLFISLGVSGVGDIPVGTLRAVLLYHVAPGERFSGDVIASDRIRTVSKGFLVPSVHDGAAYVNDARIVAADVDASNGVIHVIDRVLLPQG